MSLTFHRNYSATNVFFMPPPDVQMESAILGVDPLIRGMIRKRMHVSLRPDDAARENQDALDLYGDIWVELYRKLRNEPESVGDLPRYAARLTQNRFSDYLRKRYPVRHSLATSLRYLVEKTPAYALWEVSGETRCGFSAWQHRNFEVASSTRLAIIAADPAALGPDIPRSRDAMKRRDWTRLLDAIFHHLEAPAEWDELVKLVARITGAVDVPMAEPVESMPSRGLSPYERTRVREVLWRLWPAIQTLDARWRAAFLLNPPLGCEIDVFVENGIATIRAIGSLLEFSRQQFENLWRELPLDDGLRERAQGLASHELQFSFLWRFLPIRDALIGLLIDRTPQQVIALRRLARERLAESVGRARP